MKKLLALLVLCLTTTAVASDIDGLDPNSTFDASTLRHIELDQRTGTETMAAPIPEAGCSGTAIHPPVVINGYISFTSCVDVIGLPADFYLVTVQAGQTIDIDLSSPSFEPFLYTYLGSGTSIPTVDGGFQRRTAHYTFASSGTYKIEAGPLFSPGSGLPWSGPYTLSVSLSGGTPNGYCVPDLDTACLLDNRFKVEVQYRAGFDNNPPDTWALVKPVSGFSNSSYGTTFFYFNDSNNIEMMVKMVDQGNTNGQGQRTIAVLYGSATPLRTEVVITDTTTGVVKHYSSSFASQTGQTDFTAFVK